MIGRVSPQTELLNCPAFNNWSTQAVRLTGSATPLHVAVLCKQPETVAKLISSGAEIHLQNNLGETPLHFAALSDCKDSARILLNHGAIATFRDHLLMTPLMTACAHGSIAVEKILTVHERGEPCVDVDKMSALHHSACKSSLEVFIRLVEAGWDPQAKDAWGHSSIELAFQRKQFCPYMLMSGLDLKCLLPRGSDFTYPTIFFDWPLLLRHLLRRFPQESLPRLVNYQSSNREHPICYAARSADLISMEALIVAGVDIEHSEYAGRTALICACLVGQLESVKFLVRKGAKTQYWYKERHMNVLDAASNHPEIVDWFLLRRHMEQSARLVNSGEMEDTGKRLKNWSGVWVLNVPLEGFYSRKPGQSRLDWVKTIHSRKKDWRRMVPPNWDPVAHLSLLAAQ
jgi:ankyrin repeat protein